MSQIYKSGEKPPKGQYYCTDCALFITIDESNNTLPICEKCNAMTWRRFEKN